MITSSLGLAVDYHYYEDEQQAKRAEKKLIEQGFKTELKYDTAS